MPYPYYQPISYQPNYYAAQATYGNPAQVAAQAAQAAPQPQNNNGLIWVQGETGARAYIVAPGATVLLMDSEAERFYIKSADASGMPLPLRVFTYSETREKAPQATNAETVTRAEFDALRAEVARLAAPAGENGGLTNG